ncbi:hypothetical protein DRQ53_10170, partial [bacterium]
MHTEHAKQHLNGIDITKDLVSGDRLAATILVADNSSPVIRDNQIIGNLGGGINVLQDSSPIIEDNNISYNFGGFRFIGGILVGQNSDPLLSGNQIECNQAGAIWVDDTSAILDKEQSPIPLEESYIIEDTDTNFKYLGDWDKGGNNINSGGTIHASNQVGATATVQFTGKGVSLIYFAFPNKGGIAGINIDGVEYQPLDTYCLNEQNQGKTEHFITDNLMPTIHTLRITVTGDINPLSSSAGVVIDAVGAISDTYIGDNTIRGSIVKWPPLRDASPNPSPSGNTLFVPDHFSTIQTAISSANDGDTIIIGPGLYRENIDYIGKKIKLKSSDPGDNLIVESTVIEALHASPTVTFSQGETQEASLEGITIRNGFGDKAIRISSSSPTIKGNIITDSSGGGIVCDYNSSPLISHN